MSQSTKRYIDLVYGPALKQPEKIAVACGDYRLTFQQLHERIGSLGSAFRMLGLIPGDRVALLADNEPIHVELQGACLRSGFTLVSLNARLTDPEIEYIVKDCSPAVFIAGKQYADTVRRVGEKCGVTRLFACADGGGLDSYEDLLNSAEPDPDLDPIDNHLDALILYTSGTTGNPKGATIDRQAMTARIMGNAMEMEIGTDEVLLQNLPLFHISCFLFYAYLFRGATCILLPTFDPEKALSIMQKEGVTATNGVPTIIAMLLDAPNIDSYDPAPLRLITYGGAPIDPPLLRRALARFECCFQQQYGMTEAGSVCLLKAGDHDPEDNDALTSAGCDAAGYELLIIDENGNALPRGMAGEIKLRGPGLMTGYWGLPEKTAESIVNGWYHTGDVGYRDNRNFLHVVDRRNDMIISGGENVYPREVESVLAEHPAMIDAAVIGLPDPKWGEVVSCVLTENAPSAEELEAWLRERVAGYKIPRRWLRVPELPRTATGKVLKVQLRELFGSSRD